MNCSKSFGGIVHWCQHGTSSLVGLLLNYWQKAVGCLNSEVMSPLQVKPCQILVSAAVDHPPAKGH